MGSEVYNNYINDLFFYVHMCVINLLLRDFLFHKQLCSNCPIDIHWDGLCVLDTMF